MGSDRLSCVGSQIVMFPNQSQELGRQDPSALGSSYLHLCRPHRAELITKGVNLSE